ncbi:MAG: CDP-alcohol phosphatidyltransferase family protein [Chloroflexi bacterium]|nr:CDP-alcohol phosphatidyltransferase family protein [Chloroflexota bacterium]
MAETVQQGKKRTTFTEWLRSTFRWVLEPTASFLNRMGVQPNMLTVSGLVGTSVGAWLVSQGEFSWGGFLILLMGPIDALDGALARLKGESEDFGAFVDSVTDRYSELVVYGGLLWYSLGHTLSGWSLAVYLAAFGSMLVSYTRARAQSLGMEAKVGWFSRVERVLILGPALLFNIPFIGVAIIAAGSNLTALQRIWHVRAEAHRQRKN